MKQVLAGGPSDVEWMSIPTDSCRIVFDLASTGYSASSAVGTCAGVAVASAVIMLVLTRVFGMSRIPARSWFAPASFEVAGHRFEYSDFNMTPGFRRSRARGGPFGPGVYVRLRFSGNDILTRKYATRQSSRRTHKADLDELQCLLLGAIILIGCGGNEKTVPSSRLSSGRQVKVLGIGRMNFTNDPPALMLKYETSIPLSNRRELEAEVDDIWIDFRRDVERAQLSNAIISATTPSSGGFVKQMSTENFVFQKDAQGAWHRQ